LQNQYERKWRWQQTQKGPTRDTRLHGPYLYAFGKIAKIFIAGLVARKTVEVTQCEVDQYRRIVELFSLNE